MQFLLQAAPNCSGHDHVAAIDRTAHSVHGYLPPHPGRYSERFITWLSATPSAADLVSSTAQE
jgi:hypothetical protein